MTCVASLHEILLTPLLQVGKFYKHAKKKKKGPNNKQNFIFVPPVLGDYCEILQFEKTWNNEFVKTKVQRAQVQM